MLKKALYAAGLALLAVGVGSPARADLFGANHLDVYPDIFGARTLLGSKDDGRASNPVAFSNGDEDAKSIFVASPFFRGQYEGTDVNLFGASLAYASRHGKTPWQLTVDLGGADVEGFDTEFNIGVGLKAVVWQPAQSNLPVVSIFGRWRNVSNVGHQWDFGVAADQHLAKNLYATVNLGYTRFDAGPSVDDFNPAFGLTYNVNNKLSIAGNYTVDNDANFQDFWGVSAIWKYNEKSLIRVLGGKQNTYGVSLIHRWK